MEKLFKNFENLKNSEFFKTYEAVYKMGSALSELSHWLSEVFKKNELFKTCQETYQFMFKIDKNMKKNDELASKLIGYKF